MMSTKRTGILTFLLLGGAKRVAMAQLMAKAAKAEGYEPRFVAYELSKECAVASVAHVVEGLRWSDPDIYSDLQKVVETYAVDIVIPFVDPAIRVASHLATLSNGLFYPGNADIEQDVLFDKVESAKLFAKFEFSIPETFSGVPDTKRWIAKPRYGSASKGIILLDDKEVMNFNNDGESYLIQEYIEKREEISVDCYVSPRSKEILAVSPRVRLETMGGEAIRTITIDDPEVKNFAQRILVSLNLSGAVTIQFIRDLKNDRLMIMEINPRLGGGCTASVNAGADIPRCIVRDALGGEPQAAVAQPNILVCRYLTDTVIKL